VAHILKLRRKPMRTRHQSGWVEETDAGTWRGHWYEYVRNPETGNESRRHHSRVLGDSSKMRKFEAKQALGKIVDPLTATQSTRRDDRVPLSWFVEHRWQPKVMGNWGANTRRTNQYFIRAILAEFGATRLRDLDSVELQSWLNGLAADPVSSESRYSRSMVGHCCTYLKAICSEAVEQDFLPKDPARKLNRPKTRKPDETRLEWADYQAIIDAAATLRDKLVIKVGAATAVRPGELFAFPWQSLRPLANGRRVLTITETAYNSKIRAWAKTEASEGDVALPQRLAAELIHWRTLSEWSGERDFIFPNAKGGVLDYENFEARVLAPIRIKLGLKKLNFQILRRSFATLAVGERKGTTRDVQTMLRHTKPDVTLESYVKDVPSSVYAMSDAMYEQIAGPADEKQELVMIPAAGGIQ
jgi:integrase